MTENIKEEEIKTETAEKRLEKKICKKINWLKKLVTYFKWYELVWILSMAGTGLALGIIFNEDALWILICSMIALVSGLLCELLISKQNKWNFLVSILFVELTTLVIYFNEGYYGGAITCLVFWVPIDILSLIYWNKYKDKEKKIVTEVKKFTIKQDVLIVGCIIGFSALFGYILQLVGGEDTYLDAITSAFGIANGLFLFFRYREQWIAWYLYTFCEAALWIISGQWVMLVLSVGYLMNTTYGYIKWTLYTRKLEKQKNEIEKSNAEIEGTINLFETLPIKE